METEQKDCSLKVERLLEKHSWIAAERKLFGKTGTDYDFSSRDPPKAIEELAKLQIEQSRYIFLIKKQSCLMSDRVLRCCPGFIYHLTLT